MSKPGVRVRGGFATTRHVSKRPDLGAVFLVYLICGPLAVAGFAYHAGQPIGTSLWEVSGRWGLTLVALGGLALLRRWS